MTAGGRRGERGFTIVEMMIVDAVMVGVTGVVFSLLNPAKGTYRRSPKCPTCSSGCGSAATSWPTTWSWPAPARPPAAAARIADEFLCAGAAVSGRDRLAPT